MAKQTLSMLKTRRTLAAWPWEWAEQWASVGCYGYRPQKKLMGRTTDVPPSVLYYTKKIKNMKEKTNITEAQLLINQEVKVTSPRSQFWGRTGLVRSVMADGRTLEINLRSQHAKVFSTQANVFLDVTLVGEIQEQTQFAKTEQSLGPIANSVVQDGI